MLAKKERLSKKGFDTAFKAGIRVHTDLFTVLYSPAPIFSASAVVSKKNYKGAVMRNRLRRQIYEAIRLYIKEKNRTGTYIFIMKKTNSLPTYGILAQSVSDAFLKIK